MEYCNYENHKGRLIESVATVIGQGEWKRRFEKENSTVHSVKPVWEQGGDLREYFPVLKVFYAILGEKKLKDEERVQWKAQGAGRRGATKQFKAIVIKRKRKIQLSLNAGWAEGLLTSVMLASLLTDNY